MDVLKAFPRLQEAEELSTIGQFNYLEGEVDELDEAIREGHPHHILEEAGDVMQTAMGVIYKECEKYGLEPAQVIADHAAKMKVEKTIIGG